MTVGVDGTVGITLPSNILVSTVVFTTTGATVQNVDSFALLTYRGAEYAITIKDNVSNNYQATKLLLLSDGVNGYQTEYAQIYSNSAMGNFSTSQNGSHIALRFTPVSTSTTLTAVKILLPL